MLGLNTSLASNYNPLKHYEVPQCPSDGISSLCWSKAVGSNILACTSWDKSVRIWDVQQGLGSTMNAIPKLQYTHEGPVLACDFSGDTSMLFSAGVDKKVKVYSIATGQSQDVGQHAAGIKAVKYCDELQMCISASWDKTIKFWDLKSPTPALTINCTERVYAMDMVYPLMVVGTADQNVSAYNLEALRHSTAPAKEGKSNLKMQTRCVSIFSDKRGWAVGSVEGRVHISHLDDRDASKNFAFKCHRIEGSGGSMATSEVYPVNAISFHPIGTFATAGADGTFVYWDKDNKQRLTTFKTHNNPISCASFNKEGTSYAYAVSYDWHKGHEGCLPNSVNTILIHKVLESEIKHKTNTTRR